MRFFIIVIAMSLSTLASGSAAIAQQEKPEPAQPTQDRNAAEIQHPDWYRENAPYRPCPSVDAINGRNICLGCPDGVRGLHAGSQDNVLCPCA